MNAPHNMVSSIDDIQFEPICHGIEAGSVQLQDEQMVRIGGNYAEGPGILTVWRWPSGATKWQVERANGTFDGIGGI